MTSDRTDANGDGEKLVGIEVLRFAAAFAVLIFHYQQFLWIGSAAPADFTRDTQPLHGVLGALYEYGYAGVQLFWCISGFIFTWKYLEPVHTGAVSAGRFALARFSRLYPLHFATLLLTAGLNTLYFWRFGAYFGYAINDLKHFLLNLAFASYWGFQDGRSFNGPVWSVSVEIPVYVLFFCVSRVFRGTAWSDIAIAVLASVVYGWLRKHTGFKLDILGGVMFFYIGAATSRIHAMVPEAWRHRAAWICLGAVLVGCGLIAAGVLRIAGVSVAMFPAAILAAQFGIRPVSARVRAALSAMGDMTYASYMIHFPLQIAMLLVFDRFSVDIPRAFHGPWLLPLYLGLALSLSVVVFRGFERPMQNWLRRLGRRPGGLYASSNASNVT